MQQGLDYMLGKIAVARDMAEDVRMALSREHGMTTIQTQTLHGDLLALEDDIRQLAAMTEPF